MITAPALLALTANDPVWGKLSVARPSAPVTAVAPPPATVAPATGVRVPVPGVKSPTYWTTVTVTGAPVCTAAGRPSRSSGNCVISAFGEEVDEHQRLVALLHHVRADAAAGAVPGLASFHCAQ